MLDLEKLQSTKLLTSHTFPLTGEGVVMSSVSIPVTNIEVYADASAIGCSLCGTNILAKYLQHPNRNTLCYYTDDFCYAIYTGMVTGGSQGYIIPVMGHYHGKEIKSTAKPILNIKPVSNTVYGMVDYLKNNGLTYDGNWIFNGKNISIKELENITIWLLGKFEESEGLKTPPADKILDMYLTRYTMGDI